eukprot:1261276-Rhodomonas_salina.1
MRAHASARPFLELLWLHSHARSRLRSHARRRAVVGLQVKSPAGRHVGLESRMLEGLEKDQLREGVEEMRALLQSWYRSFALVSRLESAFQLN